MTDDRSSETGWRFPLVLPGFMPDAIPFALRTTLSLLLAYAIAFFTQIQAASTAGICVAIVAQPSAGMAFSKARYRLFGTVLGGTAGVLLLATVPQDRTMLLVGYALWLAACTFVGTLLRDFRSYAAVLSGYTAGIIAIAYIDAPASGFIAAMDRVAAITVGVFSVLLVNTVFAGTGAFRGLLDSLHQQARSVTAMAADALDGRPVPDEHTMLGTANAISALRSQATFAGTELPDGALRSNGARHAIEALLDLLSTSRLLSAALGPHTPAAWRDHLRAVAAALRHGTPPSGPAPHAATPDQVLLQLGTQRMLAMDAAAKAGLQTLESGEVALPPVTVRVSYEWAGALLGGLRAIIATGLCAGFTVIAGWGSATLLLIQGTAIVALLGATPNPSKASMPFLIVLPPVAVLIGLVKFLLLPLASGLGPFALAVGPVAFFSALMVRHPALQAYGPATLLFATLLFAPTNPETFDFGGYCNTVMELLLATVFVLATFRLILPVMPARRLGRVAVEIGRSWRHPRRPRTVQPPSLAYDRLSRVMQWLGRPTPARRTLVSHLYAAAELDRITRHARAELDLVAPEPTTPGAIEAARRSLSGTNPDHLVQAATTLLADAPPHDPAVRRAVAWLTAAATVLRSVPGVVRLGQRVAP